MADTFLVIVQALVVREGRLLLLHRAAHRDHAPGMWEPVTGKLDAGEDPREGAAREVREETGLAVELARRPYDTFFFKRGVKQDNAVAITFMARARNDTVTLSDEHDDFRWVAFPDLVKETAPPGLSPSYARLARDGASLRFDVV
jgi:8-oxo-dGTP pyrophosphatase MutT (NUDIX family)